MDELRGKLLVPSNYKTINCKQYYELGYCNYGPRCQFIHKACERTEAPTKSLGYKKIYESMLASFEQSQFNNEEIIDMNSFLEDKICLENFGQCRLQIFESCREREEF